MGVQARVLKITLPLPPNMANSRTHWRKKNRQQRDYSLLCYVWSSDRPAAPFSKATISAMVYTWSPMDMDNLMARLKWPVDFLVSAGWLVDDNPDVLTWVMPRQAVDRKHRRVEITLTEESSDE